MLAAVKEIVLKDADKLPRETALMFTFAGRPALLLMVFCRAHPRCRRIAWLLPLLAFTWQIHYSAWCLMAVAGAWLAWEAVGRAEELGSRCWLPRRC